MPRSRLPLARVMEASEAATRYQEGGVLTALGPGLLLVLGAKLARPPLSRKEQQPFQPAGTRRSPQLSAVNSRPGSAASFLFCVLVCKMKPITHTLSVPVGHRGFRRPSADSPSCLSSWPALGLNSPDFKMGTVSRLSPRSWCES